MCEAGTQGRRRSRTARSWCRSCRRPAAWSWARRACTSWPTASPASAPPSGLCPTPTTSPRSPAVRRKRACAGPWHACSAFEKSAHEGVSEVYHIQCSQSCEPGIAQMTDNAIFAGSLESISICHMLLSASRSSFPYNLCVLLLRCRQQRGHRRGACDSLGRRRLLHRSRTCHSCDRGDGQCSCTVACDTLTVC